MDRCSGSITSPSSTEVLNFSTGGVASTRNRRPAVVCLPAVSNARTVMLWMPSSSPVARCPLALAHGAKASSSTAHSMRSRFVGATANPSVTSRLVLHAPLATPPVSRTEGPPSESAMSPRSGSGSATSGGQSGFGSQSNIVHVREATVTLPAASVSRSWNVCLAVGQAVVEVAGRDVAGAERLLVVPALRRDELRVSWEEARSRRPPGTGSRSPTPTARPRRPRRG